MAADAVSGSKTLRARTYRYLVNRTNGATDFEIQKASGLNPSTQRPRRIELVECGLVRDSGKTRPTPSGRKAVVWEIIAREAIQTELV